VRRLPAPHPHLLRRRARRGAILLFFMLVFLPLAFLVGALAVDYGRVVNAQHRANQVADAAALAAVTQFRPSCLEGQPDNRCLSRTAVDAVVAETLRVADDNGVTRGVSDVSAEVELLYNADDGQPVPADETPTVVVTVSYVVEDLYFFGLGTILWAADRPSPTAIPGTATRSAFVCDSDVVTPQRGVQSCVRLR
jgi:Flp pilus assembly protein TadG